MGEIADSLISGEFDFITGEYLGEAVGYPRTHSYARRNMPPVIKKPSSKANVCRLSWYLNSCTVRVMYNCLNCHVNTKLSTNNTRMILENFWLNK